MLMQSVPCDDVSSATVQAVRVASRVEVASGLKTALTVVCITTTISYKRTKIVAI